MISKLANFIKSNVSWHYLIFILVFIYIQAIFLAAYNPGLMSPDSFDQLKQARGFFFTSWHPLFSTLYVYVFDRLFVSPIGISMANIGIFLLFILIVVGTFKENKKLLTVVLAFYCIMPIYYLYNLSLWKDVPYSYFLAMTIVFLYRVIVNKRIKDLILLLVCVLLVTLFRHNGITVTIATIVSVLLLPGISKNIKIIWITCLIAFIIIIRAILISTLPEAKTPVIINQSNFYIILMSHISSLPHNGHQGLINELEVLSPIIDPELLSASYYPGYITTLLFTPSIALDHTKIVDNKKLIVETFIKLFIKYPLLILRSIFIHGSLVWSPFTFKNSGYYVVERGGDVCLVGSSAYSEYKCDEYRIRDIEYFNFFAPNITEKVDKLIFNEKLNHIFFMRPVMFIGAIIISILWGIRKKSGLLKYILILTLPLIIQTLTMFFLAQAQDFRYHYSIAMVAPVFTLIMYGLSNQGLAKHI